MYEKNLEGGSKHFDFMILDLLCLQLAFVLSYLFRHGLTNPYGELMYRNMADFLIITDIAVIFFGETLKDVLRRGYWKELTITVKQAVIIELLVTLYLFSTKKSEAYSRIMIYIMGILYVALNYLVRLAWKKLLRKRMQNNIEHSLLLVVTKEKAEQVVQNIRDNSLVKFHIAGLVIADEDLTGQEIAGIPVVASQETVIDYVCKEWVDEVFIEYTSEQLIPETLLEQFTETGVAVHLSLARVSLGREKTVGKIGDYTVLTSSLNFMAPKQAFLKRLLDIIGGLVGCILTGIIFLFVAPAIYFQSPGPVFFSQTRVGKNGKLFKMYKFRSMYMDAEERKKELMKENKLKDGMMFKLDYDPRVIGNKMLPDGSCQTGIGDFIRRTSLDEFPQFWNVLTGSMSLVGTRPCLISEKDLYSARHRARLAVKPGITGMWQVSGRSNITDFEEVVKLDTKYISEWSTGLDLRILCRTVAVVLKKEGSM